MPSIHLFPTINASLNVLAGLLLFLGYRAIKLRQRDAHKAFMMSAFFCSMIFLCSYLTYHYLKQGVLTRYEGEGLFRTVYFFILITHSSLAGIVPFLAVPAVYLALKGNFERHKKITRYLFPLWMYVSVTGVLIYFMLYVWVELPLCQ